MFSSILLVLFFEVYLNSKQARQHQMLPGPGDLLSCALSIEGVVWDLTIELMGRGLAGKALYT